MDAFLAVVSRREVRSYEARPLPDDAKRRILEAGRLAGSSKNRQQRRFVVLSRPRRSAAVYAPANLLDATLVVAIVVSGKGPVGARRRPRRPEHDARRPQRRHRLLPQRHLRRRRDGRAPSALGEDEQVATVLGFGYPAKPARPVAPSRAGEWIGPPTASRSRTSSRSAEGGDIGLLGDHDPVLVHPHRVQLTGSLDPTSSGAKAPPGLDRGMRTRTPLAPCTCAPPRCATGCGFEAATGVTLRDSRDVGELWSAEERRRLQT